MPTSSTLTEQLATLGVHLPAWPEEPEGGGATDDWIQRGSAAYERWQEWAKLIHSSELTPAQLLEELRPACWAA